MCVCVCVCVCELFNRVMISLLAILGFFMTQGYSEHHQYMN